MNDLPALENFFAAYFHQDWAQEHATPEAVVDTYRASESDETVARTRDELDRLLARDLDGPALAAQLRALGCEFDPTREGGEWYDWLVKVRQRLAG
ncbi:hypothetical protein H0E84_05575 [Luteimonas sp. SJ-92]|uniref:CdiI immunity protein domain-containing protein n=1 Tax=Luteimonas salinisoli TaxID=2752307 RepID=A0A853J9H4_9GAMM|nr:contact-dependent growth inhibition system immunity protein [Luteimonas salinisoli]NZA25846.1 hypothetical protein [Luteimonas salinisoli]